MPAITSAASAICGTHLGDTKLVTSISFKPASCSRCTSPILTAAGTACFSFCRPSRGPTSTNLTREGIGINNSLEWKSVFSLLDSTSSIKRFDGALQLDHQRIALAIERLACGNFNPAFADAVLPDIQTLLVIQSNTNLMFEYGSHVMGAARVN